MFIRQYLRRWPFSYFHANRLITRGKEVGGGGVNERRSWEGANKNARLFASKKILAELGRGLLRVWHLIFFTITQWLALNRARKTLVPKC